MKTAHCSALELIENYWEGRRVLVIGDVMLDKYIWGTVERISPEAPVPVVHSCRSTHCPGGAGNVAMNVVGLGGKATVIGFVGVDEDARVLTEDLIVGGVDTSLVTVPDFPTTSKQRILSNNQQMIRVDIEQAGGRPPEAYEKLIQEARKVLLSCSVVILSDYAKGVLNDHICESVIKEARTLGIPVLVDPKSSNFQKYRNATTVCPNLQEMSLAARIPTRDLEKLLDTCRQYLDEYGFDFLTVTLADKGIAVVGREFRRHAPAITRQVFDVSGAGDSVIATLALCLACRLEIQQAIELANIAAGMVISKVGTAPVDRRQLIDALSQNNDLDREGKIMTRDQLHTRVVEWRAAGQRIVFTNGCFDLLHIGHVNLLERAHQQGDKLILAINSDVSVRRLKGQSRPMVGENERARVLAALSAVDAVVIFNEDSPLELIRAIRPDVLVKGDDYTEDEVIGAGDVCSWGGRLCLVPLVQGFSSSELIAVISDRNRITV